MRVPRHPLRALLAAMLFSSWGPIVFAAPQPVAGDAPSRSTATIPESATSPSGQVMKQALAIGRGNFRASLAFLNANLPESERPVARYGYVISACNENLAWVANIEGTLPAAPVPGAFPSVDTHSALQAVCTSWLGKDKKAIMGFVEKMEPGRLRTQMVCFLAEGLVTQDSFQSAQKMLALLPSGSVPRETLVTVAIRCPAQEI